MTCFLSPWSKDSLVLAPAIMRGQLESEPDYRKPSHAFETAQILHWGRLSEGKRESFLMMLPQEACP